VHERATLLFADSRPRVAGHRTRPSNGLCTARSFTHSFFGSYVAPGWPALFPTLFEPGRNDRVEASRFGSRESLPPRFKLGDRMPPRFLIYSTAPRLVLRWSPRRRRNAGIVDQTWRLRRRKAAVSGDATPRAGKTMMTLSWSDLAMVVLGVIVHSGMVRSTRPGISRFRVRASRAPKTKGLALVRKNDRAAGREHAPTRGDRDPGVLDLGGASRGFGAPLM